MNFIRQIERIERVDKFIKHKSTGDPKVFAAKLNISKRQLFRIIEELKDFGAPIAYSRALNSFYYTENGFEIKVHLSILFITDQEEKNIIGGNISKKMIQCQIMALTTNNLVLAI